MASPRHDVYIFNSREGERLVRPGTLVVSESTSAIRFRNLTDDTVIVRLPEQRGLIQDHLTLVPHGSGTVAIDWFAQPSGVCFYEVIVGEQAAQGNSDPAIIFD